MYSSRTSTTSSTGSLISSISASATTCGSVLLSAAPVKPSVVTPAKTITAAIITDSFEFIPDIFTSLQNFCLLSKACCHYLPAFNLLSIKPPIFVTFCPDTVFVKIYFIKVHIFPFNFIIFLCMLSLYFCFSSLENDSYLVNVIIQIPFLPGKKLEKWGVGTTRRHFRMSFQSVKNAKCKRLNFLTFSVIMIVSYRKGDLYAKSRRCIYNEA